MTNDYAPQGYVQDASYPITYFRELSPVWLNYVAALRGALPCKLDQAFSYLELGSGPGFSSVIHAAALQTGDFHACDFNPESIAKGEQYASDLTIENITFHASSFDELLDKDLPDFDFVVLHGVYSWVGAEARWSVRRLIQKYLKSGGMVYLSYNCMPGWAVELPLRRLLIELAGAGTGDSPERARSAVTDLSHLSTAGLRYFRTSPVAVSAVEAYSRSPNDYLAHEFLNEIWEPLYSIDVADEMAEAGLAYIGSATLTDNHDALVIDSSAAEAIKGMSTTRLQQLTADFAVNRQFRRDVFMRAEPKADQEEKANHLGKIVIGCVIDPQSIGKNVQVPRGKIGFQADFLQELRQLMTRGSITFQSLVTSLGGDSRNGGEIIRNLLYLIAAGELRPFAQPFNSFNTDDPQQFVDKRAERMFLYAAVAGAECQIASELVGGGVMVSAQEASTVINYLKSAGTLETGSEVKELLGRLKRFGVLV